MVQLVQWGKQVLLGIPDLQALQPDLLVMLVQRVQQVQEELAQQDPRVKQVLMVY